MDKQKVGLLVVKLVYLMAAVLVEWMVALKAVTKVGQSVATKVDGMVHK